MIMENYHEEVRQCRLRKKQTDPLRCPVCSITIRSTEIEYHYAIEMDRLNKLNTNSKLRKSLNNNNKDTIGHHNSSTSATTSSSSMTSPSTVGTNDITDNISTSDSWGTFQKIKNNRQLRLKLKSRKRKAEDALCPVCNERTTDDINLHVEYCLKKMNNGNRTDNDDDDEDDSIDIEGEEYEWAGQTRIRASTLLEGGYVGVGYGINNTSRNNNVVDEDEDLIVDGDDTQIYGPSQYTEHDVIPLNISNVTEEDSNSVYLRNLVIGNNPDLTSQTHRGGSNNNEVGNSDGNDTGRGELDDECEVEEEEEEDNNDNSNNHNNLDNILTLKKNRNKLKTTNQLLSLQHSTDGTINGGTKQIINSLKKKIKDYENVMKNKCKCLICLDEFKIPVVSVCCWHVHCEECWLMQLGTRKLCPQCNMITSPNDLRRIYM